MYGDANPLEYRQTLVETYLNQYNTEEQQQQSTPTPPVVGVVQHPPTPQFLNIAAATRRGSPAGNYFEQELG